MKEHPCKVFFLLFISFEECLLTRHRPSLFYFRSPLSLLPKLESMVMQSATLPQSISSLGKNTRILFPPPTPRSFPMLCAKSTHSLTSPLMGLSPLWMKMPTFARMWDFLIGLIISRAKFRTRSLVESPTAWFWCQPWDMIRLCLSKKIWRRRRPKWVRLL